MKTTVLLLLLLCTSAAFAQYSSAGSGRSAEPVIVESPSHPAHASYAPLSTGQSILASAGYSTAQGERPPSDFPQPEEMSLGMAARELRKHHEQVKKSRYVYSNQ